MRIIGGRGDAFRLAADPGSDEGQYSWILHHRHRCSRGCLGEAGVLMAVGVVVFLLYDQGLLQLQYSALAGGEKGGKLFSLFWCTFMMSAVAGGLLTFGYFAKNGQWGERGWAYVLVSRRGTTLVVMVIWGGR
jgi:hypothetical protein